MRLGVGGDGTTGASANEAQVAGDGIRLRASLGARRPARAAELFPVTSSLKELPDVPVAANEVQTTKGLLAHLFATHQVRNPLRQLR